MGRGKRRGPPPFLEGLRREWEALVGPTKPAESAETRLLKRRDRRRRALRNHGLNFALVNGFLFLLWLSLALTLRIWFPWFIFPLLGWGMGYASHAVATLVWLSDHREQLAEAEAKLGLKPPASTGFSGWKALKRRCTEAVEKTHEALARGAGDPTLHESLQSGLDQTLALLDGAERLDRTVAEVAPGGVHELQAELARVEQAWATAQDPRLREVHAQQQSLLQARRDKLQSLRTERDRIMATVESFILATDNLKLDALRLTDGETTSLQAPIQRLQEELEILQKVQSELKALGGG